MYGKKCVYVAEIVKNKFIKVGISKEIAQRKYQLEKQFGNCMFLEIFECENFREVEENILSDKIIKNNLYKQPINGHISNEIILISETFNYNELLAIVNKYVSQIHFLTPTQLLEKQKLDLDKQKLDHDLLMNIINNNLYSDTIKEILKEKLSDVIQNIQINNNVNHDSQNLITNTNPQNLITNVQDEYKLKSFKRLGKRIQKIDPNNLKKVIEVHDSMANLVHKYTNLHPSAIYKAVKDNRIYHNFRWNFIEDTDDPKIANIEPTNEYRFKASANNTIIKLNSNKTKILDSFSTKHDLEEHLNIGRLKMSQIINKNEIYNNHYYIEYKNCPQELLDKYDKPINKMVPKYSKIIEQTNVISNQSLIFNSLTEIYNKLGITSATIMKAVKNKTVYAGYKWELIVD